MITARDLKRKRPEKPKELKGVSTSSNRAEVDTILKTKPPKPGDWEPGPKLKDLLTLRDGEKIEKEAKTADLPEGDVLRSPISDDLDVPNGEGKLKSVPWIDPEGNFQKLTADIYRKLTTEDKKAYSAAKKAATI